MKNKLIWLFGLTVIFAACDVNNDLDIIQEGVIPKIAVTPGSADFSKYVAIGASFTAGYTDGALFKAGQENSFPNILSKKFSMTNGGTFTQPLMNDNIGGLLLGGNLVASPRLYFNQTPGSNRTPGPAVLSATPTTEITTILSGSFNNMGVPGAKSFHIVAPGYGNVAGVASGQANPYFARMASSSSTTVLADAMAQKPTFFTVSELGGNDVLGYAVSGGSGKDQTGNLNFKTYGADDITDPNAFAQVFSTIINTLTANGAKGVIATLPNITALPHFTTVPYNPLKPTNPNFGPKIPTLNNIFGAINGVFAVIGVPERAIVFATDKASPVVIKDEYLEDKTVLITQTLMSSPTFPAFVQSFGLPTDLVTLQKVAGLLGRYYGQARQATAKDLLVLPSSSVIGTINKNSVAFLKGKGLPQQLANMFSVEGVSLPLEDKWVLTPQEQMNIKTATEAYNATIKAVAASKKLAVVDFEALLNQASTTGIVFDQYTMTASLVTGGLVGLDGIHLTARGYALMANKFLEAIDNTYGSNFTKATNGLAKAGEYPTNYSATLK